MTMLAVKIVQHLLWLFLILIVYAGPASGQSSFTDSTNPALSNTLRIYANATGTQAGFYNGVQYRRYPNFITSGQPFFIADSLINGTVTYDGVRYENVKLQYDEVNDQLITTDVQGDNLVQLYKPKVSAFSIGSHIFTNLTSGNYPGPGYYRVLYSGKSQIIVKEVKSIQVRTGDTRDQTIRSVEGSVDYYLKTQKGYTKFNRLNSFLSLFGKDRKAVAGFIKDKRLKYRQDKENLFYQAVTFYDQLTD
ncbi:MAG: hypothetical protein JNK79_08745 [Chitinophagaceae bacterium]|nr:hypothetical protein [Chitinophagaceae bacterium]